MKEMEKLKEQVEEKIKTITEQGVQGSNLEVLGKLVDIHKDLKEVEHWENEDGGKAMYKGEYGNRGYGARGNYREGGYQEGGYGEGNYSRRGNYREGNYGEGEYGARRRDSRGRYRGEEMIDEMYGAYGEYEERREQYNRGNYGSEDKEIESVEYMMGCVVDLVKYVNENAHSQEVKKIIQKHIKKMQEM